MVAYRFVPFVVRETTTIMTALRLRGWEISSKNPKIVLERGSSLAYTLTRVFVKTIDEVNIAARIKAFGASKYTPVRYLEMSALDKLLSIISLALFCLAVYFLFAHNIGTI